MQRIMTSTALVFAGALLLSGCASGGGGGEPTPDACAVIVEETRNVSNGAQNTLAAGGDPAELQTTLQGYSERVATLEADAENEDAAAALATLGERIDAAAEFAATLPSDPEAEVDAEAVAEQQTGIQEASVEVTKVCTSDGEEG